ncbi:MAG: MFS transporter [Polyangiaceae bacterium]
MSANDEAKPGEAPKAPNADDRKSIAAAVIVAALGYFVDIYDLILFSVVGRNSLKELGVPAGEVEARFASLLDTQMLGMLSGGLLWGILGDRRGRLSVLFGSILLYSIANLVNGWLPYPAAYPALRFLAGVGLAGELGAGITLVSEIMNRTSRGWGTTIVAGIGVMGAIAAAIIDRNFHWRTAYYIGGGMGLTLLALRLGVRESGMFKSVKANTAVSRGNFLQLFTSAGRFKRYLCLILSGIPIWYVVGILVSRSPKIAKDMGLAGAVVPGTAVMMCYTGLAIGDLASGFTSQLLKSRRFAVLLFVALTATSIGGYFLLGRTSLFAFYAMCLSLGIGAGYWAVFVTMASEQFGTNIRSTVTTTAPNFVRGSLVLVSAAFGALEPRLGPWKAAAVVGAVTVSAAVVAILVLDESYGKDLDFVEHD